MPSLGTSCLLAGVLLLGASCVPALTQNPPREPNDALPARYHGAPEAADAAAQPAPLSTTDWRAFFGDPRLSALVEVALRNNQELNLRMQEIVIARSELLGRQGEYLPRLEARAGAGIEKVGEHTRAGRTDRALGLPEHMQHYDFGFAASWELDVFGKLRSAAKAASFRYLASIEGQRFMVTQLIAEIASTYYELLALDNELAVLARNVEIQQRALEIVNLQKQAARATQLAVQRFEAEVLKNQSRRYDLEQQRVEAENHLNVLLGRYPQAVERDAARFRDPLPAAVRVGLPAELLDNRPDVRQAALLLTAAKLDVRSARAAFYPSLSIEAGVGYESFNLKHLVSTPESLLYNLAGNLTAPLLNRRAIEAEYAAANGRQLQAVFVYERTLLSAYTEVVNQLSMIANLQKSYDLEARQVRTLTESIEVSNVLFQSARADYMEVLLTRRDSLEAEMELIETKNRQLQAMVHVYRALGGGWR